MLPNSQMAYIKISMDDQMRALYTHKLNQEKAGKLGKGRKADRAPCLAVERLESIAQFMNALDKAKLQDMESVGSTTNQFHYLKCQTSNSVAS